MFFHGLSYNDGEKITWTEEIEVNLNLDDCTEVIINQPVYYFMNKYINEIKKIVVKDGVITCELGREGPQVHFEYGILILNDHIFW